MFGGRFTVAVAGTNDLATCDAATCQSDTEDAWPVIAPPLCVELWRPTELAHDHDECFIEQPSIGEIVGQR